MCAQFCESCAKYDIRRKLLNHHHFVGIYSSVVPAVRPLNRARWNPCEPTTIGNSIECRCDLFRCAHFLPLSIIVLSKWLSHQRVCFESFHFWYWTHFPHCQQWYNPLFSAFFEATLFAHRPGFIVSLNVKCSRASMKSVMCSTGQRMTLMRSDFHYNVVYPFFHPNNPDESIYMESRTIFKRKTGRFDCSYRLFG